MVGAGVVGLLVTFLCASIPGCEVTVIDLEPSRAAIVALFGASFSSPTVAPVEADVVFHASATAHGFNTAIKSAGMEATVVELSWYGEKGIDAHLGGAFHARRLRLTSSQVGQVSPSRRPRWSYRRRLEKALELLQDVRLDVLVETSIAFDDLPARLAGVLTDPTALLPPVIVYPST